MLPPEKGGGTRRSDIRDAPVHLVVLLCVRQMSVSAAAPSYAMHFKTICHLLDTKWVTRVLCALYDAVVSVPCNAFNFIRTVFILHHLCMTF